MRSSVVLLLFLGCSDGSSPPDEHEEAGGDDVARCHAIDVVIAVDNSTSMREERAALTDTVFPAMANALLTVGGGIDDFRVAVLDACPNPATYHTRGTSGDCGLPGRPWLESTDPGLTSAFACLGAIDSSDALCSGTNDDEQPASAAAASFEDPWRSGANAGFLRDDALLVVLALTDEDEQPLPQMDVDGVYGRLIAAKGAPDKMAFLGVGGAATCQGVYGSAREAVTLRAVSDRFESGLFWDLCQGDLGDGLTDAIGLIDQACVGFPGTD